MFRFYSFLSPNGTPEPAALMAAREAVHAWNEDDGALTLQLLGVYADQPVFCVDQQYLYIHQPGEILKVPCRPGRLFDNGFFADSPRS